MKKAIINKGAPSKNKTDQKRWSALPVNVTDVQCPYYITGFCPGIPEWWPKLL